MGVWQTHSFSFFLSVLAISERIIADRPTEGSFPFGSFRFLIWRTIRDWIRPTDNMLRKCSRKKLVVRLFFSVCSFYQPCVQLMAKTQLLLVKNAETSRDIDFSSKSSAAFPTLFFIGDVNFLFTFVTSFFCSFVPWSLLSFSFSSMSQLTFQWFWVSHSELTTFAFRRYRPAGRAEEEPAKEKSSSIQFNTHEMSHDRSKKCLYAQQR